MYAARASDVCEPAKSRLASVPLPGAGIRILANISTSSRDEIVIPFDIKLNAVKGSYVRLCWREPYRESLALFTTFLHFSFRVAAIDFLLS